MHVKGEITTCGSQILKNYKAPFQATAIQLLEDEDAILIGKTNLDEFAMGSSCENSSFFPTLNPWNLSKVPGGSSGGSAAAVAARICPIALGSDTGGSIRQPASFCGIVGFKPTYGRVSRYGLVAYGSSLDHIGPITTSVEDAGLMMEVIGKHCNKDATSLPLPPESYLENRSLSLKGKVIGVPWNFLQNLAPAIRQNFEESVRILQSLGAVIESIDLPILHYAIPTYYILATAEASTNLARYDGIRYGLRSTSAKTLDEVYDLSRDEGLGKEVKRRILIGSYVLSAGYKDAFYKKAQKVRTLIIREYEKAFSTCDFVITPVCPSTAFSLGSIQDPLEMYQQDLFTVSANLAGLPAISVPAGFGPDQLPIGLQILGPQLHDVAVIQCAHAFEQKTLYGKKHPPLFTQEASK
jgi:aspartyl-tRNA(Asn)/glutamyl-tRNA(Gln) amidotransferase subunit A